MKTKITLTEKMDLSARTGRITRNFFIENKICHRVEMKEFKPAQQHAGYTLIDLDLEDSQAWLTEFHRRLGEPTTPKPKHDVARHNEYHFSESNSSSHLLKALWFSAIMSYAKCFSEAKGRRIKLERTNVPSRLRACHDKIISFRNTLVAHAGEGENEAAPVELILSPIEFPAHYWIRNNVYRLEFIDDRHEVLNFEDLIKEVHKDVVARRKKLELEILREVDKFPPASWRAKAITLEKSE